MAKSKTESNEVYQPSLAFLKELTVLAGMCEDHNSDMVKFDLGPIDGFTLEVSISFLFKEV